MSQSPEQPTPAEKPAATSANTAANGVAPEREYDRSGFYPKEGPAFRVKALLAWNIAIVVLLAIAAAVLNMILLPEG